MPERSRNIIQKFFDDMQLDISEERVLNYIIREVHKGRKLSVVIQDTYVRNRLDEKHLAKILEKKEVIQAVEEELTQAFKDHDFKFAE